MTLAPHNVDIREDAQSLPPIRRKRYHRYMARGWESKSVEEQVTQKESESAIGEQNPAHKKMAAGEKASVLRQRQSLELQRERILSERTSSPHRRAALTAALSDVESKLNSLT
jgi:hypothetical protein